MADAALDARVRLVRAPLIADTRGNTYGPEWWVSFCGWQWSFPDWSRALGFAVWLAGTVAPSMRDAARG